MQIVIPIGGTGERFKEENFPRPKPLINFLGKPILYWLLDNLPITTPCEIHIPYNSELEQFNFEDGLRRRYPKKFHFYKLNFKTRGAAETVYAALNNFSTEQLSEPLVVLDCDNIYLQNPMRQAGKNCIFYFEDHGHQPIYSYLNITPENEVTDIQEKVRISDYASSGAYSFENAKDVKDVIEEIIKANEKSKNEFYISTIYQHLLKWGTKVYGYKCDKFISLGTPDLLRLNANKQPLKEKLRFCFDLDNTLVTYPQVPGDYTTVKPISKNIALSNFLFSLGHEIIIYTARRMKTHAGDQGKVIADVGAVTQATLKEFGIKYNELYFGKPYADFYIDDSAINAFDNIEKAIGIYDLNTEPRAENSVEYLKDTVIKRSMDLTGLIYYYNHIPKEIREKYHPAPVGTGADIEKCQSTFEMERIYGNTLSQLYVNQCFIKAYLDKIFEYFEQLSKVPLLPIKEHTIYENYYDKTEHRLRLYKPTFKHPKYEEVCAETLKFLMGYEKSNRGSERAIHGDPVFSNIILDGNNNLKFIDMRGRQGRALSIYGDTFYDYAKVYQSLIGYDEVLHDKKVSDSYRQEHIAYFEGLFINKFTQDRFFELRQLTKSLLLSMLPLHNNEKCEKYFELIFKA